MSKNEIDLESLREVRDYFADRQDAEQLAGESFPTPNEEMRLLVTVDSVLAELTARRARDAEVAELIAAASELVEVSRFAAMLDVMPANPDANGPLPRTMAALVNLTGAKT